MTYTLYLIGAQRDYVIKGGIWRFAKIGHTKNIKRRFSALDCSSPLRLKLIGTFINENKETVMQAERDFKKEFFRHKAKREWYYYDHAFLTYFNELNEDGGTDGN